MIKKLLILLLLCAGIAIANTTDKNITTNKEFYTDGKLKTSRTYEDGILVNKTEYSTEGRPSFEYRYKDGALILIIEHARSFMNGDPNMPLAWDYVFFDAPIEIVMSTANDDRSQSQSHLIINISKIKFTSTYNSKDGKVSLNYEADTPENIWIALAETFNKEKFASLKSVSSAKAHDGQDVSISVKTASGTVSVMNYSGQVLESFFNLVSEIKENARAKAK